MNPVVLTRDLQREALDEITDIGNLLDAAILALFQNDVALGDTTVLADLALADFTGYAASAAIVWGPAFLAPGNRPTVAGDMKSFVVGTPVLLSNIVYGWAILNAGGTVLLAARKFDTPIPMTTAFQSIDVVPAIPAFLPE